MPADRHATLAPTSKLLRPSTIIALLVAIVALIGAVSRLLPHGGAPPAATPVRTADLVMRDQPDGSVVVTRAAGDTVVDILPPATNAFVRVLLTGLVRERRREGMGAPSIPFHLTRWSDGRLTIDDDATHGLIELQAFGTTNAGAFERLLELSSPRPER